MCKLHKVSKGSCCYVPLIPTTPHTAAGIRIDPPPSVPKATGHRPEKNRIIKNSHWLLPFVIEQTPHSRPLMFLRERRGSPRKKMPHGVEGDTRGKRLNRLPRECF